MLEATRDTMVAILNDLFEHDEAHGENWGEMRGPLVTITLTNKHGSMAGLLLHRLVKMGLVERAPLDSLRSNVPGWPSSQPWCQPWRLTANGCSRRNWPL